MSFSGTKANDSAGITASDTVDVNIPQGTSVLNIDAYGLDADGNATNASAGALNLSFRSRGGADFQTLYESDGTTQATIDLTDPETWKVTNVAAGIVRATPNGSVAGITTYRLAVSSGD